MLAKMKLRVVSILMGTALTVAPMSLGTCELMYTPSDDISSLTEPIEVPGVDGSEVDSEEPWDDGSWTGGGYYYGGFWYDDSGGMMP